MRTAANGRATCSTRRTRSGAATARACPPRWRAAPRSTASRAARWRRRRALGEHTARSFRRRVGFLKTRRQNRCLRHFSPNAAGAATPALYFLLRRWRGGTQAQLLWFIFPLPLRCLDKTLSIFLSPLLHLLTLDTALCPAVLYVYYHGCRTPAFSIGRLHFAAIFLSMKPLP